MKALSPALQAHLDDGTTTLSWCWRITRADGVTLGFTDHDTVLTFDGTAFEPESGFAASEVRSGSDLSVDAQDAEGVLTSDRITETDIVDGRWDNAAVELWRANWADPSQRVLMRLGAVGQIRRGRMAFVAEVRSLAQVPYFSRGWRDDAIQRAYLEATFGFWGKVANNPISGIYGASIVSVANCAVWTWDARPYPFFPQATDIWSDGPNWRLGHWLTGRLGAASLAALVRHLCLRAGLAEARIDVAGLCGAVEGYVITALESPRASISMLAQHFGFDAVESEGRIKFIMRGQGVVATITPDTMVAASGQGEVIELTRGQETELPQALKWQLARADADYDAVLVEAQRITVSATRVASDSFPMAVPPEEAERRCRRALMEVWVGRESAVFKLPPSRLALDPCDVILLNHDGRLTEFRLISVADNGGRSIEARRQDRAVYDLPPGTARSATLPRPVSFGVPDVLFLDLPQLSESTPAHQPLIAADSRRWSRLQAM